MARVHEVVHTLRQKPRHVRENIALGIAGGVTFVVALGWLVAFSANGTLAFSSDNAPDVKEAVDSSKSNFSDLLGAAGAAFGASSTPAEVTIVETNVRSTLDEPTVPEDATVIHF